MKPAEPSRENSVISMDIKKQFTQFIQTFTESASTTKTPKYLMLIEKLLNLNSRLLVIDYEDFIAYNCELANFVFDQFYKYQKIINQTLTQLVHEYERTLSGAIDMGTAREDDRDKDNKYEVTFNGSINGSDQASIRDLRCDKLGKLFCFKGTVTRTTEVRPQLVVGVFKCKNCNTLAQPLQQDFKYTEPKKCFGKNCDKPSWQLDVQKSQISDFQKIRVQQDPTKIPPGAMPRSIDVVLRNQNAQKGQPGDICKFVGYLCVLPQISSMMKPGQKTTISTRNLQTRGMGMDLEGVQGFKGIRQLNHKLIFIANNVIVENNQFRQQAQNQFQQPLDQEQGNKNMGSNEMYQHTKQIFNQQQVISKIFAKLSEQEIKIMMQFKQNINLYQDLANSLFPSIFGQIEIKKAILLQLFSGIHKITKNKITIRGDINILIVGDPSTAKSQFLKAVNKFVPRSVYTNGKTTSAAGLTATVTKDDAGSVGIQAGALMLADNGICCIDQFDKMNYSDQTAIHEAMEQQTISIAKAGVFATLNARTSILAAANPIFGRYDKSKSLKNNINISAPIMSRFDLFFVVCDQTNDNSDANLSEFIINMHRNRQKAIVTKYDAKSIKLYISTAKKLKPMITKEGAQLLRKFYHQLRLRDKNIDNNSYRATVRQLQSMIRISEALARLYLDTEVKGQYVTQAYRLITTCMMKLQKSPINLMTDQEPDERHRSALEQTAKKGDIALQRELQQKKKQKSSKQVSISYQQFQQLKRHILQLFKKRQQIQKNSEEEILIDQQSLVNYILGIRLEAGMIDSQEHSVQMKKIINAVIKKLIKEQRVLMVVEDDQDKDKKDTKEAKSNRVLKIHPNFEMN